MGRAVHGRRDQVQLATKFGIDRNADDRACRIRGAWDFNLVGGSSCPNAPAVGIAGSTSREWSPPLGHRRY
ncbi:hypothetical protein [Nocardia sp. NPDC056000]|uniref:hypothetical protein n=1 Tax=Nocardia sp. NPDC056000 TaxID=3345674 RepID=UPI0035E14345